MARYRKLDLRTWNDQKFRELSPLPPSGQALWLYLVLGPHTTSIPGLFEASEVTMADRLRWPVEVFRKTFGEIYRKGMAKADWEARLVWLPRALEYNRPESANVIISWGATFDELPECALKWEALQTLKVFAKSLPKSFGETFGKVFAKVQPIQEQEQEQDLSPKPPASVSAHGNGAGEEGKGCDPMEDWRQIATCDVQAHEAWLAYRSEAGETVPAATRWVNAKFLAGKGSPESQRALVDTAIRLRFKTLHDPRWDQGEKPAAKEGRTHAGLPIVNP